MNKSLIILTTQTLHSYYTMNHTFSKKFEECVENYKNQTNGSSESRFNLLLKEGCLYLSYDILENFMKTVTDELKLPSCRYVSGRVVDFDIPLSIKMNKFNTQTLENPEICGNCYPQKICHLNNNINIVISNINTDSDTYSFDMFISNKHHPKTYHMCDCKCTGNDYTKCFVCHNCDIHETEEEFYVRMDEHNNQEYDYDSDYEDYMANQKYYDY